MTQGHCLCGKIRYEVRGPIGPIVLCHCSECRHAQGSAFAANAEIKASDFVVLSGAEQIKEYQSSPDKLRTFCGNCGSPLYSRRLSRPQTVRLRIGTLETPIAARPMAHIFASSKAA
jgi:hypothetical protein